MTGSSDKAETGRNLLSSATWLKGAALAKVFEALGAEGGQARVVGGSVRNALIGQTITDIDIATPLRPDDVMRLANAAGLGVHPTGIEHGTVTIVADAHPFEVTTLRRDIETDGRRAVVAFSQDWREDAARRDFTMNALYATADGQVFDYFGGLEDLANKRVRFIGNAEERIREDYLRILRFFRFNAQYAHGAPDPEGLTACIAMKDGLARLSAERIGAETMKLLAAPRAADVVAVMAESGILASLLGPSAHPERLAHLIRIEQANGFAPDTITRLAALVPDGPQAAAHLAQRLRLSNVEADALAGAAMANVAYDPSVPERHARAWAYKAGTENFRRGALVAWAASTASEDDRERRARALLFTRWTIPPMPVRGADAMAFGLPSGPAIGKVLAAFETWWIAEDFPSDPALHKAKLAELCSEGY